MPNKFPHIHNPGKAMIENGEVTFTYMDSLQNAITKTKAVLTAQQIVTKTKARLARFKKSPIGTRESESSRAERKYISAHPESLLRRAFELMDEHTRMEMSMMLDRSSHAGISDPAWAQRKDDELKAMVGDDGRKL